MDIDGKFHIHGKPGKHGACGTHEHTFIYHNETTYAATGDVFWAMNTSNMHLWLELLSQLCSAYSTPKTP